LRKTCDVFLEEEKNTDGDSNGNLVFFFSKIPFRRNISIPRCIEKTKEVE
jgi:hypothetical protein